MSITDAAGHDIAAGDAAGREPARCSSPRLRPGRASRNANDAIAANSTPGQFVTGQLLRIDLNTAAASIISAGHPFPLRLRAGRVEEVTLDIDLPFGIGSGRPFRVQRFPVAPGDRIIFVTDGMLERNAAQLDVAQVLEGSRDLHPREVVPALGAAVMHATGGNLRDDATVVCLDWYGGHPRPRPSTGGASQQLASS